MRLWKLNACPKCKGPLFISSDYYGQYLTCGNCGWQQDLDATPPLPKVTDVEADREGVPDGCNVSPSCFTCPLEECAYGVPTTRATYVRDQVILDEWGRHEQLGTAQAVDQTARKLELSARTVYRALARNAKLVA